MNEPTRSDEELLRAMQDGEEEAFVTLYRRWQAAIFRFGLQMTGSRAVAEDATQEVFIALIRDSQKYRPSRGSFGAWLYGIARHVLSRSAKRQKCSALPLDEAEAQIGELSANQVNPYDQMVRRQQTDRLKSVLLNLPVHYREVLVLCVLHEMNYTESARALGCRVGTVRSRLHRARLMLAERLRLDHCEPKPPIEKTAPDRCPV